MSLLFAIFFAFSLIFLQKSLFAQSLDRDKDKVTNAVSSELTLENPDFYQDPTEGHVARSYEWQLAKMILILILFMVSAYFILKFLRTRQTQQVEDNPYMKVITDFPITMNKHLKVVQVVNDFYLLSVTQEQVQLIDKLTDKEAVDMFKLEEGKAVSSSTFFQDVFSKYVSTKKVDPLRVTKRLRDKIGNVK